MNPRIAVALPVLPALAHAATLRWHAAYLDERFSSGGFIEVSDGLRDLSYLLIGFAVVLVVVALLTPGLVRLIGMFLLYVTLPMQFIWFELQAFIFWEDHNDPQRETTTSIALTYLATAAAMLAASIVAVVALRRSRAGRNGGTAARADRAPTSSTGPLAA
jgi:hypothetical protein